MLKYTYESKTFTIEDLLIALHESEQADGFRRTFPPESAFQKSLNCKFKAPHVVMDHVKKLKERYIKTWNRLVADD